MLIRILLLLIIPITINSQSADDIIDKVQKKFDQIDDLKANFSQTIFSNQDRDSISFEGEFHYKKEDSFNISLPNRKIISDGKSVWNYNEQEKKVVISEVEFDETSFSLKEIIYNYPKKCDLSLVKRNSGTIYIKATPRDSDLNFENVFLTINDKYLLNKVEIVGFDNMRFTFELFSIRLNQNISDDLFQFHPSEEVEIIDLR